MTLFSLPRLSNPPASEGSIPACATGGDAKLLGGDITTFDLDRLYHLITLTQHVRDILLNEIEQRGERTFIDDTLVIPDMSDYAAETILTRGPEPD